MSGIFRDSAKLLTANVVAQAIGLLVYPVLTRLYSPDDFGLLNLFSSIAGVAVLFATAEFQYAIVLPKENKKAVSLTVLSLTILLAVTAFLALTVPFAKSIAAVFKAPDLTKIYWLLPVFILLSGFWNVLNYNYLRNQQYMRMSGYQISQSVFAAAGKLGFGFAGKTTIGLPLATVLAQLGSLGLSLGLSWKKLRAGWERITWSDCRSVAREYRNFPMFNLPRALVNSLGQALPVWFLTPCFGLEKVGHLSLALLAAFVPLNIIARACYQVLFQKVSEAVQQQLPIRQLLCRFMLWMVAVLAVGMAVVYFFVPQLVTVLFGAEWAESAQIIRRMYPYLLLMPVCGTICFLSDVFAKQKIAMWMEAGYVAAVAVVLFLGTRFGGFLPTISAYAWVGFSYLFIQLLWFVSLVRHYQQTLEVRSE